MTATYGLKVDHLLAVGERPFLWSSGQSFWLQIQSSRFDFWRYKIFCEVVGLERGPLSLVSTTEELFEGKSSGSGLENQDYVQGVKRWIVWGV
jgi:hypothetical protein